MTTNTVNISAQIPAALSNKLEKVAKFEERPKSYYIRKALEIFLEEALQEIKNNKKRSKFHD
jgi:predicted DNA-binding protein